jgi:NADPH:quinone reductase-like Zn-dependent oxidoreductase
MQVLEVTGEGGLDSLAFAEKPVPRPAPGEVVVKVAAAALNHRDLSMVNLMVPATPEPPFIPMSDCAGAVHAIGDGVDSVKVGDRVTSLFFQRWLEGPIRPEVRWATLASKGYPGVAAEYVTLLASGVFPTSAGLSDREASTLPCAALTAWRAMFEGSAPLPKGATVLIQGTGGVSIFALQFAVAMGLEAVVTSSSDEKLERAKRMGAAHTVNYRDHPDWGAEVTRLVGPGGVDFVLGVGGAGNLAQSLEALSLGGRIAIVGMLGGAEETLPFRALVGKNARLEGVSVGSREMFARMAAAIERHGIRPVVDAVYPFQAAPEAFRALKRGAHFGKIVIDVSSGGAGEGS